MTAAERADTRRAVRARRVFDGLDLCRAQDAMVLIESGFITDIDTTGAEPPAGVPLEDLGDVTVLPGLIDTHTHLAFDASDEVVAHVQQATPEELSAQMRRAAASMLRCGITTIRDLGDRDYLSFTIREETAVRPETGPTILAAGPPLTPTGGHCWFLGGQADGLDGISRAVAEHAARGADVIKMMVTGGRMTPTTLPHESQYTLNELRAAVDRAHERGLTIAGHAHGRQGIADALAAGFDTLEHVSFMTADGIAPDQGVIDAIAASGIISSVTVGVLPGAAVPPPLDRLLPLMLAHLKNMYDSGVRITIGPDGGVAPAKPHDVLPHALSALVEAGIPARAALAAVTSTAAEACGLKGRIGRVAPGHSADLLAVSGDPLTDIAAIHRPSAIYRRGRRVL